MGKVRRLNTDVIVAVNNIKDYIDTNPLAIKKIEELVRNLSPFISRKILQRGFKSAFGSTIKIYERKKRMEAAASILDEGVINIKQLSTQCGYGGKMAPSNFTRAFKGIHGMTPTEWQKRRKLL
jgi:AraC-like DNA-binding protein